MVNDMFERTEALFGKENVEKLNNSNVLLFGLGGVGGICAEALVRSGIGRITIVDCDVIDVTNINRQVIALYNNIGEDKVIATEKRLKEINPGIFVNAKKVFVTKENAELFFDENYDYVVDAIDNVTAKLSIIENAKKRNIPIICAMGTANKIYPELLEVSDIFKTSECPLCKVMRHELKERKIKDLKVVFSKEKPIKPLLGHKLSSSAFVPPTAGLIIAGEVVRDIVNA